MKERGIKPVNVTIGKNYWIFYNKIPQHLKITGINIADGQRQYVLSGSTKFEVVPNRENGWGFSGLIPLFETKNECLQYEIDKLTEQLDK